MQSHRPIKVASRIPRRAVRIGLASCAIAVGSLANIAVAGAAPANDNFANATVLTGTSGTISGTTVGATLDAGETPGGFWDSGENDVWYKWVAPADGTLYVNIGCTTDEATFEITEDKTSVSQYLVRSFGLCSTYSILPDRPFEAKLIVRSGLTYHIKAEGGIFSGTSDYGPFTGTYSFSAFSASTGYAPVTPRRLLDTRNSGALDAGSVGSLQVTGVADVPTSARAVVLNVTTTRSTASSYLTVYPTGGSRPNASAMNWRAGDTTAAMTIAAVGSGGYVNIYNSTGSTDVLVDVMGYFSSSAPAGYVGLPLPKRFMDTRTSTGVSASLGAAQSATLQITGRFGVPSNATAVAINLTSVRSTAAGYVAAWPAGTSRPNASVLNRRMGETVANLAIVPIGTGGKISLFNSAGTTDLVGDVTGYFTSAATTKYQPVKPSRVHDTRTNYSIPFPLGPDDYDYYNTDTLNVAASAPEGATDIVVNLTGIAPTLNTYLTTWGGSTQPTTSNINLTAGRTRANMAIAGVPYRSAIVANKFGEVNVAIDLNGFFWDPTVDLTPFRVASGTSEASVARAQRDAELRDRAAKRAEEPR